MRSKICLSNPVHQKGRMIGWPAPYIATKGEENKMKASYKHFPPRGSGRRKQNCLLYGLIVSVGIFLTAVTGIVFLISNNKMELASCGLSVAIIYGAAVFAGCYYTGHRSIGSKLLQSGLCASICCILLIGSLYGIPGKHELSVGRMIVITAAAWLSSGMLCVRKKRNRYE